MSDDVGLPIDVEAQLFLAANRFGQRMVDQLTALNNEWTDALIALSLQLHVLGLSKEQIDPLREKTAEMLRRSADMFDPHIP